jgi:citrate lyase beta subunit
MPPRQPVHVLYGGAHLFRGEMAAKLSRLALCAVDEGGLEELAGEEIAARVRARLAREPVEDYRIDFEDGFGVRSDQEEDAAALSSARAVAASGLPRVGIRIKSGWRRGERTLKLFLDAAGSLDVLTLPKVTSPAEVERAARAAPGVPLEVMIETPEALRNARAIVSAGPVAAAHFGPYDFTSSLGVPAAAQSLTHPLCDHARHRLLVELAGTGVRISDGPTATLPLGARAEIRFGWQLHMVNVRHALASGIYQGWDLHPAQIPARLAALYAFYRENLPASRERWANYREKAAQATRVGQTFDDAATVRGLEILFRQGLSCGALDESEIPDGLL